MVFARPLAQRGIRVIAMSRFGYLRTPLPADAAAMGDGWIVSFAIVYIATLTPYRILMTWVYANTKSVLLAALMHASYTSWLLALFPATSPTQSLVWQAVFAAALWILAAMCMPRPPHSIHRPASARPMRRGKTP
jgi:hypothetical protein